jgi:2,3-bisphosphoglycerate-dependent phosphoglycerate mutase
MKKKSGQLILVRHGESTYNKKGLWAGRTDVSLTVKGYRDALKIGRALRDLKVDTIYDTELRRTQQTLQAIRLGHKSLPKKAHRAPELNERDYGDYAGLNKWQMQDKVGDEVFQQIRRAWNYPVPHGETLKKTYARVVSFYQKTILPQLLAGKNVLVVAHGNSIRALMKYLENISDDDIANREALFDRIWIYTVDDKGRSVSRHIRKVRMVKSPKRY